MPTRLDNARLIRAPRGPKLSAKSWLTEAPLRMLMNNLDPEVAERPHELVVYGGTGRAARDWKVSIASSQPSPRLKRMRRCACNPVNRSACFARTRTSHAC